MPRRGVGIGAIQRKEKMQEKFKEKGTELASVQLERLRGDLELFTVELERFSEKYRDEIRRNPQFRIAFQEMCAAAGVDPLASSRGTFSSLLGVGDFYYELAVQIVEVCMSTSHLNGGLMTLDELRQRLARSRKRTRREQISTEDIQRAVEKLSVLGNGFALIPLTAGRCLVQSVPAELSMDHTRVLQLADDRPVKIPLSKSERAPRKPPDFIRNIMGSASGSGSAEFHIYRNTRKRQWAREEWDKKELEREKVEKEWEDKINSRKAELEAKTEKRRKKRLKEKRRKMKAKGKSNKPKQAGTSSESDDSDGTADDDNVVPESENKLASSQSDVQTENRESGNQNECENTNEDEISSEKVGDSTVRSGENCDDGNVKNSDGT